MTLQFDDILAVICTEVTPSNVNDYQKIYILNTDVEAKLAFDVLIAFGFNARVYHTPDKPSKLYISNPKMTAQQVDEKLSTALVYAHALKTIKGNLDQLCRQDVSHNDSAKPGGYTITFVNAQPGGKQISIQLHQAASDIPAVKGDTGTDGSDIPAASGDSPSAVITPGSATPIAAKTAQPVITAASARISKYKSKKKEDGLGAGPAVGRGLYPGKQLDDATRNQSWRKRIMLRLFGNFATSGYSTVMWLVLIGVLFSCFVGAKSFLCYDFVAKKSTKWYCQDPNAASEEELRRQEQEERKKKVGLAPLETAPQR